ncbi:MAG: amidohydrolase family protein [Firmicutes bacterium]|nr:amidohydrolase family protein [Bacillota bacterium]
MYDLVINNGLIVDGNLTPAYTGSIGITGDKIIEISQDNLAGRIVYDATGLIVSPGFIDMHSHGDFLPLLEDDYKYSRIKQGITTEIVGQCGIGPIPYNQKTMAEYKIYTQPVLGDLKSKWNFTDLNSLTNLTKDKMPHNMGYLIGLSALRSYISGLEFRRLNPKEMKALFQIYEEQLQQGALGMSMGLSYLPGVFANHEELIGLAKLTKKYDGIIMAHIRSHGVDMLKAIEEFINIGRETGARIHISHCRSYKNKDFGITASEILNYIKKVRKEGVKISLDQHPYTTGSTFLNQLLPPEDRELDKYEDKDYCSLVEKKINDKSLLIEGWDNMSLMVGFNNIYLPTYGCTVEDLAEADGVSNFRKLIEILKLENGKIAMVVQEMFDIDEISLLLKDQETFIGSDGLPSGRPHPRLYGAFPKVISDYVRNRGDLSLEQAIYKMTGGHNIGFKNRGIISEGNIADLVIFDYNTISHEESYSGVNKSPVGISRVIIGGKIVCSDGKVLGEYGQLIRRVIND